MPKRRRTHIHVPSVEGQLGYPPDLVDGERVTTGSEPRRERFVLTIDLAPDSLDREIAQVLDYAARDVVRAKVPTDDPASMAFGPIEGTVGILAGLTAHYEVVEVGEPGRDERTEDAREARQWADESALGIHGSRFHDPPGEWQPDPRTVAAVVEALREQAPESAAYISNLGNALNYAADFVTERFPSSEGTDG